MPFDHLIARRYGQRGHRARKRRLERLLGFHGLEDHQLISPLDRLALDRADFHDGPRHRGMNFSAMSPLLRFATRRGPTHFELPATVRNPRHIARSNGKPRVRAFGTPYDQPLPQTGDLEPLGLQFDFGPVHESLQTAPRLTVFPTL